MAPKMKPPSGTLMLVLTFWNTDGDGGPLGALRRWQIPEERCGGTGVLWDAAVRVVPRWNTVMVNTGEWRTLMVDTAEHYGGEHWRTLMVSTEKQCNDEHWRTLWW